MAVFILVVARAGEPERRYPIETEEGARELTVGRSGTCDIQLGRANVHRTHARIAYRPSDGAFVVTDLNTQTGTYVNGTRVRGEATLEPGDTLFIGDHKIRLEDGRPVGADSMDPSEQEFLAALDRSPTDDATRLVYGDWLEERGRSVEAEVLVLEAQIRAMGPDDPLLGPRGERLRKLAARCEPTWLRVVSRAPIERCPEVRFTLSCPKTWDMLKPTEDPTVRACDACKKNVYYAPTIEEARRRAQDGACVALHIGLERSPDDLDDDSVYLLGDIA